MTFLSVLSAFILEHYLSWTRRDRWARPYLRWCTALRDLLDSGTTRHGVLAWLLAVGPVFLLAWLAHELCQLGGPALPWIVDTVVLCAVVDFKSVSDHLAKVGAALRAGAVGEATAAIEAWEGRALPGEVDVPGLASRAIQLALLDMHRWVLAPVLWFVILPGSTGPLVYVAALAVQRCWSAQAGDGSQFAAFANRALRILDWLPARMTALSFAVVGNFEESLYCWRNQTRAAPADDARVVLAAGAGAIGVHFEPSPALPFGVTNGDLGTGDYPGPEHLQNAEGLLARTLVFAVVLLGLLTLAGMIGI